MFNVDIKVKCIKDINFNKIYCDVVYQKDKIYRANYSKEKFIEIFRVFRGDYFPLNEQFSPKEFFKHFIILK